MNKPSKLRVLYSKWLHSITVKQVIIYTVIFTLFIVLVLPFVNDLTYRLIGVKESIDTGFITDLSKIYKIRDEYGPEGRKYYIILRFTFDIVWPIVYFLFIASITGYLTKHLKNSSEHRYINYLPILAVSLDFLENILASIFMIIHPYTFDLLVFLIIVVSLNKWVWILFSFIQILWLSIKRGLLYVRK